MVNALYDVYLICHSKKHGFSDYLYNRLTQHRLNVLFINQQDPAMSKNKVGIDSDNVIDAVENSNKEIISEMSSQT